MSTLPLLIRVPVSTRWGDMDAFNHVNNSVYSTYLEEARLRWFASIEGGWTDGDAAPVIAGMKIDFRRPVKWPAELIVELYVGRIGARSLTLPFRMIDRGDEAIVYAEGDSVLVWTSPATGSSLALPEHVRRAVTL